MSSARFAHYNSFSMKGYTVREVAEMLGLAPSEIRSFAAEGFLKPEKGSRGELLFSFQDLVLLRTAAGLTSGGVPARKVRRALKRLMERLPSGRSLTELRISAAGERVIVQDEGTPFDPDSGQVLFAFTVADLARRAEPLALRVAEDARSAADELSAEDWYELGCELEIVTVEEARGAYERSLTLDPNHADAHLNLGRLLHEEGDLESAFRHYEAALRSNPEDSIAHFNLGVVLEDRENLSEALSAYEHSLELDEGNADAHYNLAGVYERLGQMDAALRHLKRYKKLVEAD